MFTPGIDEAQCVNRERGFTNARFCKSHMFTPGVDAAHCVDSLPMLDSVSHTCLHLMKHNVSTEREDSPMLDSVSYTFTLSIISVTPVVNETQCVNRERVDSYIDDISLHPTLMRHNVSIEREDLPMLDSVSYTCLHMALMRYNISTERVNSPILELMKQKKKQY